MENENIPQPFDALMTRLGLTNADLVHASTQQLSFKMVQKGRRGRRLTPNIQSKILTALLAVKPDLNLRRGDLFRYEMVPPSIPDIESVAPKVEEKKVGKKPKKKAVRYRRRSLTRKARVDASTRFFKTGR